MGFISFLGHKGKVYVCIERFSHEELRLEIKSAEYKELRKTLLELMKNYKLSPELIHAKDITIATHLLL